ncbi:hypothetical protein [Shimia biformata]|uniref:hypothetical protein n=1 Tax=Shimia biformata TaxID=1294299 RepID=UPI0019505E60|nr:hypothetical protein [Shimia biformata]
MVRWVCAALVMVLWASGAQARQGVLIYKYYVTGVPEAGDMEVVALYSTAAGAAGHWCGAGEYAGRYLGASNSDRIYLTHPIGPSRFRSSGKGVGFSLSPGDDVLQASTAGKGVLSETQIGANLSVSKARSLCDFTIAN